MLYAGSPASAMPGKSGTKALRSLLVTANPFRRPACTIGNTDGGVPNVSWVSPATTDWIAGAPPLKGICCILTLAIWLNNAAPRWGAEPLPEVA